MYTRFSPGWYAIGCQLCPPSGPGITSAGWPVMSIRVSGFICGRPSSLIPVDQLSGI